MGGGYPIGVSGLMRVKNEEQFIAASIDSCIDALDELVICYEECTDNTPAILEAKRRQYPDKITLWPYPHKIIAHNLSEEEFEYACSLPVDSPNLLSGYYNYTLSKARFRYAMKIDADQIYFTDYLKQICDMYRFRRWKFLLGCTPWKKGYDPRLLQKIALRKPLAWLSGVNLFIKDGKWHVPGGLIHKDGSREAMSPFNGVKDHCIFRRSEKTYYVADRKLSEMFCQPGKNYLLIESFRFEDVEPQVYAGLFWHHLQLCKPERIAAWNVDFSGTEYSRFRSMYSKELEASGNFAVPGFMKKRFVHYQDDYRDYPAPPEELLPPR